jgi:Membrane-associated phospholipid phosphatase
MNRTTIYPTILLLVMIIMLPAQIYGQQNGKVDFRNDKTGWNTGTKSENKVGGNLKVPTTSMPNVGLQYIDSLGNKGLASDKNFFRQDKFLGNEINRYSGRYQLRYGQLIIPTLLIGTGLIGIESDWLKYQNREIRDELQEDIDRKATFDDFSQYVPMAAVYGLNLAGIKGKNNFRDRTMILATSYLVMGVTVESLKNITRVERPDGSSRNSFPSGHTATAFMGAEFLWQEYKDVSPWIGVAGYSVAAGTGFFRMYNNRHWLTDVMAGAGIGILSTKMAYWAYPYIQKKLFGRTRLKNVAAMPFYSNEGKGLSCMITF